NDNARINLLTRNTADDKSTAAPPSSEKLQITTIKPNDVELGFMPQNRLYPTKNPGVNPTELDALIQKSINLLDDAMKDIENEDLIASDDNVQNLQVLMTELFCFRDYSEGVGHASLSIYHALQNKNGEPLNLDELAFLRITLYRIQQQPFLDSESALEIVSRYLDGNGFDTDPKHGAIISEMLDMDV
ncbi:MAG TPA: hypothetical protein PK583_04760, partial [Gammaproteobacteria bacterium]|nr:hypothetical protein [Gammaproteobacteria bacterium]